MGDGIIGSCPHFLISVLVGMSVLAVGLSCYIHNPSGDICHAGELSGGCPSGE